MKVGDICYLRLASKDTVHYSDYCVISFVGKTTEGNYYHVSWFDNNIIGSIRWYDHELVKVDTDMTVEEYKFYLQL